MFFDNNLCIFSQTLAVKQAQRMNIDCHLKCLIEHENYVTSKRYRGRVKSIDPDEKYIGKDGDLDTRICIGEIILDIMDSKIVLDLKELYKLQSEQLLALGSAKQRYDNFVSSVNVLVQNKCLLTVSKPARRKHQKNHLCLLGIS